MHWIHFRPTKRAVFWSLFVLAAVCMLMPPQVSNYPKHSTQLLTPLQDILRFVTFEARQALPEGTANPSEDLEKAALKRELASRTAQVEQLRGDVERLRSVRDRSIPAALQAHVVAWDIASSRDTAVIERGSELGTSREDWVASHVFFNRGSETAGLRSGEAVIAQEVLLGRVDFVSPYVSRVRLLSDTESDPILIRITGQRDGETIIMPHTYSMRGQGRGEMLIKDVPYSEIDTDSVPADEPRIRIGDLVTSAPGELGLPVPMVVGEIKEIHRDAEKRLVYDIVVESVVDRSQLRYVYVIPLIPTVAMD